MSYVALISAPVLPIRERGACAADSYLRNLGAPEQSYCDPKADKVRIFGQDAFLEYIDFDVS